MLKRFWISADPASRRTMLRILVTLGVAAILALFVKAGHRLNFFVAMTGLAVLVTAVLALRARQTFNAPHLNHWDETVAYIAISILLLPLTS